MNQILNNASDAIKLARQCPVVWGNVQIGPNITGILSLDGITNITGDLRNWDVNHTTTNHHATGIESRSLLQVDGLLDIQDQPEVQSIIFPNLLRVGKDVFMGRLPSCTKIDLSSLQSAGDSVWISRTPIVDILAIPAGLVPPSAVSPNGTKSFYGVNIGYTDASSITGFTSSVGTVDIEDNPFLGKVEIEISDTHVDISHNGTGFLNTGYVSIYSNAPSVNISLPNLATTASSMTLGNCSELFIPALSIIGGSLQITNASFSSFSAPNLSSIDGNLNITGNFTRLVESALIHCQVC